MRKIYPFFRLCVTEVDRKELVLEFSDDERLRLQSLYHQIARDLDAADSLHILQRVKFVRRSVPAAILCAVVALCFLFNCVLFLLSSEPTIFGAIFVGVIGCAFSFGAVMLLMPPKNLKTLDDFLADVLEKPG